jgi:hypothetical protein
MDTQEVRDLYEAYLRVHQPQELTEEVEIAAQYFYEMGLNEEGVEILIEELGVEEFSEFVYDLAEEYYLTEARAGGVRVEPVTAKGTKFKGGKPTGKSLERLRAKKEARREAEASASEAKPSGLKSSLQRQSAIANAKKQQPKKKGILDRVAGAVLSGMERHNKAMGELKKMKSATAETAGKVKKAAGEFKKGFVGEEVEAWVNNLLEEGYDLSEYTWDDMCEMYLEQIGKVTQEELPLTQQEHKQMFLTTTHPKEPVFIQSLEDVLMRWEGREEIHLEIVLVEELLFLQKKRHFYRQEIELLLVAATFALQMLEILEDILVKEDMIDKIKKIQN